MNSRMKWLSAMAMSALLVGCATESSRVIEAQPVAVAPATASAVRSPISVGKFDNRSSYLRGVFSDGNDRLGSQAKTILLTSLQQTNRFSVLDRENMTETKQESAIRGNAQHLKGARLYLWRFIHRW